MAEGGDSAPHITEVAMAEFQLGAVRLNGAPRSRTALYVMPRRRQAQRVTFDPAADRKPAWVLPIRDRSTR